MSAVVSPFNDLRRPSIVRRRPTALLGLQPRPVASDVYLSRAPLHDTGFRRLSKRIEVELAHRIAALLPHDRDC